MLPSRRPLVARQERERLGAVNLRADDELVEVLGARDKLIAESDDLTEAIKRLRTAIGALNQEGRERLVADVLVDRVRGFPQPRDVDPRVAAEPVERLRE